MKKRILTALMCIALVLSGCGTENPSRPAGDAIAFTDDFGNQVSVSPSDRVAVFSGSLADAWILAGGELLAVTEDYFQLPDAAAVPTLGSLTAPNLETLLDLEVDVVFLSANIAKHTALKPELEALGIRTAYFEVEAFGDFLRLMEIFTDITGRKDLYETNAAQVEQEIYAQVARADASAPTVLFLRSYSTGIKAKGSDSMTGQMLKDLGCINIADTDSAFSADLSLEAILMADPDFIFVTTMGNDEAAMEQLTQTFESNPIWQTLSAVKNGRYHILDKELFQNKPNDRWAESYRILADILYGGADQ